MFAVPSFFGYNTTFINFPVATAATGVGDTSFTANWNAFAGAQYYLLDVSISPSFSSFVLQDQVVYTNSYAVTGLTSNTTYYYRLRASTTYDTDAEAFFTRVSSNGGSLTTTEQQAVNSLVIQMKADGIWSAMKAIYPMVGASAEACKQNLKSASFTGSFSSGWTFASTGVTPNGTSAFFNTTLIPNTSLTLTSGHISFYSRTNNNTGVYDMAAVGGATEQNLIIRYVDNNSYSCYGNTGQVQSIANASGLGLFITNRNSATNTTGYKNGSLVINGIQTSLLSTSQIFIGAAGTSAGTATGFSTKQCAFASIGDGLTDQNALDFYNAVQAFHTTLSRNV